MNKMYTLLCTFVYGIGWRVSKHKVDGILVDIRVINKDNIKLLQIPSISNIRPGRFLNPKTTVIKFKRALNNLSILCFIKKEITSDEHCMKYFNDWLPVYHHSDYDKSCQVQT